MMAIGSSKAIKYEEIGANETRNEPDAERERWTGSSGS